MTFLRLLTFTLRLPFPFRDPLRHTRSLLLQRPDDLADLPRQRARLRLPPPLLPRGAPVQRGGAQGEPTGRELVGRGPARARVAPLGRRREIGKPNVLAVQVSGLHLLRELEERESEG